MSLREIYLSFLVIEVLAPFFLSVWWDGSVVSCGGAALEEGLGLSDPELIASAGGSGFTLSWPLIWAFYSPFSFDPASNLSIF